MYYVKANVRIKVAGISGPFEKIHSHLVHAPNPTVAKDKFEAHIRYHHNHMLPEKIVFDYLEVASEIK